MGERGGNKGDLQEENMVNKKCINVDIPVVTPNLSHNSC